MFKCIKFNELVAYILPFIFILKSFLNCLERKIDGNIGYNWKMITMSFRDFLSKAVSKFLQITKISSYIYVAKYFDKSVSVTWSWDGQSVDFDFF